MIYSCKYFTYLLGFYSYVSTDLEKISQANEVTSESSLRSLGLSKHRIVSKDRVPSQLFLSLALAFGCPLTTLPCFLPLSAMCNGSFCLFYHHHLQFNTCQIKHPILCPHLPPLLLSSFVVSLLFSLVFWLLGLLLHSSLLLKLDSLIFLL